MNLRLAVLTALLCLPVAAAPAAEKSRPNIVVIYTDDQGYGDMSALNPQAKFPTPHLNRLAREGIVFTDGHSADTVCTPSRYALLTGRYAWRTSLKSGVLHSDGPCLIAKDRMTVASLLKGQGYHTAIIGKWHLQMKFPGTIGQRDGTWVFNLNRVDVRTGELLGRVFREVAGDLGAVAGELQDALPALYAVVRRPATILVSSNVDGAEVAIDGLVIGTYHDGAPVRLEGVAAGQHEVRVRSRGHRPYLRAVHVASGATLQLDAELGTPGVSPLVWVGGGLLVAGGGSALAFGLLSQSGAGDGATRAQAVDDFQQRRTEALLANIGFAVLGAGAITLGIGVILSLLSNADGRDEAEVMRDDTARLEVVPLPGGAALTFGGSL